MAEIHTWVDAKIAGKKVVVFSKAHCQYCRKAKAALNNYIGKELSEDDYEVVEIEDRDDCQAIQDYLRKLTGARSVPRVFINGKCIGGGDETSGLHGSGKLGQMLKA